MSRKKTSENTLLTNRIVFNKKGLFVTIVFWLFQRKQLEDITYFLPLIFQA